jgi:DNA-binding PadR family transcriptional regulator
VTIERLYSELQSAGAKSGEEVRLAPEQHSEVILNEVVDVLFDGSGFRFEESIVKENLDVVLLLLIANRSSGTHGKGLMGDLATIFDAHLSPGTVYPQLHDLQEEGLLDVQELVRTKEYRVEDEEALAQRVTAAMEQHLTLGLFLRTALAELDSN